MDILVPICICCVLPVSIVLIVFLTRMNADNKRSRVMIKAIESGADIDYERLAEMLGKAKRTPREILNRRLLYGCIFSLIGLVLMTIGVVGLCAGSGFDADAVSDPMIFGGLFFAIGVGYLIVYFVTRKEVKEIKEE